MTRVLITGASGFIGRSLVAAFANSEHQVRAAVREPPQPSFPSGIEVVPHPDLAQSVDWRPLLAGVDKVIHLAGIAHSGRAAAPELYNRINCEATAELARTAATVGVNHLIFVSSIRAQSGPSADHALTENDAAAPTDPYGRSKLGAEAAVRASGVPSTILRPVLVYGPGVKGNFALLLRAANLPLPLPIRDFGNRRSLLGIDNFISALKFVASTPTAKGETYVVADPGMALRLSDVIATMREAQGRRPFLLPLQTDYFEIPLRALGCADIWERFGGNLRVDSTKLVAAGWRPPHDTRAGLAALVHATARPSRQITSRRPAAPQGPDQRRQ